MKDLKNLFNSCKPLSGKGSLGGGQSRGIGKMFRSSLFKDA